MLKRFHSQRVFDKTNLSNRLRVGLVAHYPGAIGSGFTLKDYSGYGYDAAFINAPVWTLGFKNKSYALDFDGSNDYIKITAFNHFVTTASTLACWFKIRAFDTFGSMFLSSTNGGSAVYWQLGGTGGEHYCQGISCAGSTTSYADSTWHHYCGITDSAGGVSIYLDNILYGTGSGAPALVTGQDYTIGDYAGSLGTNWRVNGALYDIRIYNRAISLAELSLISDPKLLHSVNGRYRFAKRIIVPQTSSLSDDANNLAEAERLVLGHNLNLIGNG